MLIPWLVVLMALIVVIGFLVMLGGFVLLYGLMIILSEPGTKHNAGGFFVKYVLLTIAFGN
jgi:hypothetical protein